MAMPKGLLIAWIIALVNALAKLHNFCIEEKSPSLLDQLNVDTHYITSSEDGYVPMEASEDHGGVLLPTALMNVGHHFSDISRNECRQHNRRNQEGILPQQRLLKQLIDSHLKCPTIK